MYFTINSALPTFYGRESIKPACLSIEVRSGVLINHRGD